MDMNQTIIEPSKDETPRTTEIIDKFTNKDGQVNVTQLASNLAQKEREKSFLLKVIGGASAFVIIAIGLMIVSVVIGTAIMRDTKVKNGVLVSNRGSSAPIQVEPTNYTFYFSVYDDEETIAKVKTVRIPILSNGEPGMLSFDVHEYLFIPKSKIVLSGLRYSLEVNRYGHHVMINDPTVNPYEVSEIPSTNFERAIEENRIVKASYSKSIQHRNVNSLDRRFNRSPAQLRREIRSLRERGVEADEEQNTEDNNNNELQDFVSRHTKEDEEEGDREVNDDSPTAVGVHNYASGVSTTYNGALTSHGGETMSSAKLYVIYYGNFETQFTAKVTQFLKDYASTSSLKSPNSLLGILGAGLGGTTFVKEIFDKTYSVGNLTHSTLPLLIKNAFANNLLKAESDAIYSIISDSSLSINYSGNLFCTAFCAFHTYTNYNGMKIKYAVVGDPRRCPKACASTAFLTKNQNIFGTSTSPLYGAEGAINVLAHEIVEAISDPVFTGYYDAKGLENADKCAWKFYSNSSNGYNRNLDPLFGTNRYHVQLNFHNTFLNCQSTVYPK